MTRIHVFRINKMGGLPKPYLNLMNWTFGEADSRARRIGTAAIKEILYHDEARRENKLAARRARKEAKRQQQAWEAMVREAEKQARLDQNAIKAEKSDMVKTEVGGNRNVVVPKVEQMVKIKIESDSENDDDSDSDCVYTMGMAIKKEKV
ncbi:hypothetical protein B0T16DRAFT_496003 [Cercophora newfieldiana]|uniref:Uncharacterized protein n=1 Tax=Cercophora newfieldiana TaxID=92897 RepID=A0AA39XXM4_9PEZI|nr:hypothetical protein B0T16DRAFT_496003 [Cercophora newfieldiana]